jgi:hypothetical protein
MVLSQKTLDGYTAFSNYYMVLSQKTLDGYTAFSYTFSLQSIYQCGLPTDKRF